VVFAVEQAHHDQRVIAVGTLAGMATQTHAFAQPAFFDETFTGVQRQRTRVERLHVEPEAVRVQVAKRHALEQPHTLPPEALAFGLKHQSLELDAAVRVATALQDDETIALPCSACLDDEVPEVGKAHRAFMLRTFPRRDEGEVALVGFDRDHEVQIRQQRGPQAQHRRGALVIVEIHAHCPSTWMLRS
jgi:hypothetical protein